MARASGTPGLEPSVSEAAAAVVFLLALLDRDDRFDATAAQPTPRHGWRPGSTPCHPSRGRAAAVACPGRGGRCGSPRSAGKARRIDVLARAGKPAQGGSASPRPGESWWSARDGNGRSSAAGPACGQILVICWCPLWGRRRPGHGFAAGAADFLVARIGAAFVPSFFIASFFAGAFFAADGTGSASAVRSTTESSPPKLLGT